MKLVVGLGNPGKEYELTYHNIGFMSVDFLLENFCDNLKQKNECKAITFHTFVSGQKIIVAKPQTYMNLSGQSVLALMTKYKIKPEDVYVLVDDIDQEKGKIRFREKGSGGTHNGLRNIVSLVGENFRRIRIGISKNPNMQLCDYVLSKIDSDSLKIINESIEAAVKLLLEKLNG